jgi:hypothetical protein
MYAIFIDCDINDASHLKTNHSFITDSSGNQHPFTQPSFIQSYNAMVDEVVGLSPGSEICVLDADDFIRGMNK